jgi:hypothetical protein
MTGQGLRWLWSVSAYALLLLLGFLNPRLVLALTAGLAVGILVRFMRTRRRQRTVEPPGRRRHRNLLMAVLTAFLLAIAFAPLFNSPNFPICPSSEYGVAYEGMATSDPDARVWTIRHELIVPNDVFTQLAEAREPVGTGTEDAAMEVVRQELTEAGWTFSGTRDGQPRYTRTQLEPLKWRWWPLLTQTELTVPSPSWGACPGVVLLPGKDSKLTLTVPAYLIVDTFPSPASSEDMFNGNWRWVLPATNDATDNGTVRMQIASRLVRTKVTSMAAHWSLSTLLLGMLAILGAVLTDLVKEFVGGPIRRLLELLHILKPKAEEKSAG